MDVVKIIKELRNLTAMIRNSVMNEHTESILMHARDAVIDLDEDEKVEFDEIDQEDQRDQSAVYEVERNITDIPEVLKSSIFGRPKVNQSLLTYTAKTPMK